MQTVNFIRTSIVRLGDKDCLTSDKPVLHYHASLGEAQQFVDAYNKLRTRSRAVLAYYGASDKVAVARFGVIEAVQCLKWVKALPGSGYEGYFTDVSEFSILVETTDMAKFK